MKIRYVQTKLSKLLENVRDLPANIDELNSYLGKFLEKQIMRMSSNIYNTKDVMLSRQI